MSNEIEVCTSCWEEDCVCDYERYILLDANIAEAIINMNLKGYKTFYSCEGHIEPDDGTGRTHVLDIYFKAQDRYESLPEGFAYPKAKVHTDAHRTVLYKYVNGVLHARINKKYIPYDLEADKVLHLEYLKNWAKKLTPIDKQTNPYCYSEYMLTGKPKKPDYFYEVRGWDTYSVELDKCDLEKALEHISEYSGKVEEIKEIGNKIQLFYLAKCNLFSTNELNRKGV